jgi:hypothetical protein
MEDGINCKGKKSDEMRSMVLVILVMLMFVFFPEGTIKYKPGDKQHLSKQQCSDMMSPIHMY